MSNDSVYTRDDFNLYETEWFDTERFWESVQGLLYQRGIFKMNEFMSEHFGVSRTTVWRWKKGRGETPISVIMCLAHLLEMRVDDYRQMNFDAFKANEVFQDVYFKRF